MPQTGGVATAERLLGTTLPVELARVAIALERRTLLVSGLYAGTHVWLDTRHPMDDAATGNVHGQAGCCGTARLGVAVCGVDCSEAGRYWQRLVGRTGARVLGSCRAADAGGHARCSSGRHGHASRHDQGLVGRRAARRPPSPSPTKARASHLSSVTSEDGTFIIHADPDRLLHGARRVPRLPQDRAAQHRRQHQQQAAVVDFALEPGALTEDWW